MSQDYDTGPWTVGNSLVLAGFIAGFVAIYMLWPEPEQDNGWYKEFRQQYRQNMNATPTK